MLRCIISTSGAQHTGDNRGRIFAPKRTSCRDADALHLVQVGSGLDGMRRLVGFEGSQAEIEYFESPVGPRSLRAEVAIDAGAEAKRKFNRRL